MSRLGGIPEGNWGPVIPGSSVPGTGEYCCFQPEVLTAKLFQFRQIGFQRVGEVLALLLRRFQLALERKGGDPLAQGDEGQDVRQGLAREGGLIGGETFVDVYGREPDQLFLFRAGGLEYKVLSRDADGDLLFH